MYNFEPKDSTIAAKFYACKTNKWVVIMKTIFVNKRLKIPTALLLLFFLMSSCDSEEMINDTVAPEIQEFKSQIATAPNLEFNFEGQISDETGLKSVRISYLNWFIDKRIVLDETPKEFTLNYKFLVPKDAIKGSTHTITVEITDLGENVVTKEVLVNLNLDITKPTLKFISPIIGGSYKTGELLPIKISITDDFGIASLQIKSADLNIDNTVAIGNGVKSYAYDNEIQIPTGLDGSVILEATAIDEQGNETTVAINIIVGADIIHTNLYLLGASTWYGWDAAKATRMWQDPNDDQWFIVEFYYKTSTDIKFLAQLDTEPFNWGTDPNDNSKIINAQNSVPIGFADGDGYYRVRFNPYVLEYTYEKMTNNMAEEDTMYLVGKGFVGYRLDWNPADAIPMVKDTNNPYVFSIDIEFSDEVNLKFIGQQDWGPFNAGFENGGEKQLPLNYIKGVMGDTSGDAKFFDQSGKYKVTFDYFLLRITIQPL